MIKCGFIGLGSQGAPIARRMINAGFPVTLWARRTESLAPYRNTSAEFATTIAQLGAAADHVGICVVNDDDVREVCTHLLPAMGSGTRIAIHSTIHPDTCRLLEIAASEKGIGIIDAPVSGGSPAAEAGSLTLMLGGDSDVIAASMPVFQSFGQLIVRMGPVGSGQHAKLINNTLLAANLGLADCALRAGEELGLDGDALLQLLLASSGRSFGLEVRGRMRDPSEFSHGAALLLKDMRLLGEVLGPTTCGFKSLRRAGEAFLDRCSGHQLKFGKRAS